MDGAIFLKNLCFAALQDAVVKLLQLKLGEFYDHFNIKSIFFMTLLA